MSFKERIKQDLGTFFNVDEFSEEIVYKSKVIRDRLSIFLKIWEWMEQMFRKQRKSKL